MKKIIALAAFAAIAFTACKKGGYDTTENGLQYKIHTSNEGKKPSENDLMTLHIRYKTNKDSVLFDTWKTGAIKLPLVKSAFKGSLEEGLALLSEGDSATFLVSADSLFEKTFQQPRPEFIEKGSMITFDVKIQKIQSLAEVQKDMEAERTVKQKAEKEIIENYIKENNVTVTPTESGLYYIPVTEGKGAKADSGKTVSVEYTGKFFDGIIFDASSKAGRPIEFVLGTGSVIKGWEEAISKMRVGGKAKLIIPSEIAYGGQGAGDVIPPYTPLLFEVELKDVKAAN